MTATFNCPECGETTEMTTKVATGVECTCSKCGHNWMVNDKGEAMETPKEPDGRAHVLRLGQRTGQVAILASKSTRDALSFIMEGAMDSTSFAKAIKRKPVAFDTIQRSSTEMGPTAPAAKSQVSNYSGIRRSRPMRKSIESQAQELIKRVIERQKHTCEKCGGDGEVEVEGEGKVTCPSCMGSGQVRRRQSNHHEAVDDRQAHHELWDRACDAAEKSGKISGAMMLIDFLAEVYNGGIDQYISNGKASEYAIVMKYLQTLPSEQSRQLLRRMQDIEQSVHAAEQAEEEAANEQRRGGSYNEDPFEEYQGEFGALEDWVYNDANIDPILNDIAGPAVSVANVVQPQNSPTRTESVPENPNFNLRPMTDEERMGFQGVEDGPDGQPPLVGELDSFAGGYEGLVIVDKNSVQVHFDSPGGDGYHHNAFIFQTPYAQGRGIAQQVARMTKIGELVRLGFQEI